MMQRRIVDFGLSKYAWLSMKHDGVQYHARHQLKYGQLPSKKMWYKLESSLKRGIKSGKIALRFYERTNSKGFKVTC